MLCWLSVLHRPYNASPYDYARPNGVVRHLRHNEAGEADAEDALSLKAPAVGTPVLIPRGFLLLALYICGFYILQKLAKPGSPILDANTLTGRAVLGFLGGATSGLLLSTGTCAFELVKVRSQLEYIIS